MSDHHETLPSRPMSEQISQIADIIEAILGYTNGWRVTEQAYRDDCEAAAKRIVEALTPPPPRVLREVTLLWRDGTPSHCKVSYSNGYRFSSSREVFMTYATVSEMISNRSGCEWSDDVIAQCLALKDDPYEPVETVEDIVREHSLGLMTPESLTRIAARLRAAFAAEQGGAE